MQEKRREVGEAREMECGRRETKGSFRTRPSEELERLGGSPSQIRCYMIPSCQLAHCKKGFVILALTELQLLTWLYGMILE